VTRSRAFVSLLWGIDTVRCVVSKSSPRTSIRELQMENFLSLIARGPRTAIIAKRSAVSAASSLPGESTSTMM
jgi:hypothetical protein